MQEIHSYWNKSVYVKNINCERKIHSQNEHVYGFNVIMTPVASINLRGLSVGYKFELWPQALN